MTTKFFPLFFKNTINLNPIQVNIVYSITWPVLAMASMGMRRFSVKTGRVPAAMLGRYVASMEWCVCGYVCGYVCGCV